MKSLSFFALAKEFLNIFTNLLLVKMEYFNLMLIRLLIKSEIQLLGIF